MTDQTRTPKKHDVKIWPIFFECMLSGHKTCDVRFADRDYQVHDEILFREYTIEKGYTGRSCRRWITHVLADSDFCKPGFVVISLRNAW